MEIHTLVILYLISFAGVFAYKRVIIEPIVYNGTIYIHAENSKLQEYASSNTISFKKDTKEESPPIDIDKMTFAMVGISDSNGKPQQVSSDPTLQVVGFANTMGEYMTATSEYIIMEQETSKNAKRQMWHPIFFHNENQYMIQLVDPADILYSDQSSQSTSDKSIPTKPKDNFTKEPPIKEVNSQRSIGNTKKCVSVALLEATSEVNIPPETRIGLNLKLVPCNSENSRQKFNLKEIKPIAEDSLDMKNRQNTINTHDKEDQKKQIEALTDTYYKMAVKPLETIAQTLMHILNKLNGKPMISSNGPYSPSDKPYTRTYPYDPYAQPEQERASNGIPLRNISFDTSPYGNQLPPDYRTDQRRPLSRNNSTDSGYMPIRSHEEGQFPSNRGISHSMPQRSILNSPNSENPNISNIPNIPRENTFHPSLMERPSSINHRRFDTHNPYISGYAPYERPSAARSYRSDIPNTQSILDSHLNSYDWHGKPSGPFLSPEKDVSIYPNNPKSNNPTVAR